MSLGDVGGITRTDQFMKQNPYFKKCQVHFFTELVESTYSFYKMPTHPQGVKLKVNVGTL